MKFKTGRLGHGWFAVLVIFIMIACDQKTETRQVDSVDLQLKWVHQAQFTGFYMAEERGYFRDENIAINFIEGGKDVDVLTSLVSGRAHFAVASSDVVLIQRHTASAPITAIAAIYRKSAVVYVTKANADISGPADFIGKTAAIIGKAESHTEFEYQFKALMKNQRVDISKINLVPYDPSYAGFYSGKVDITAAYYTGGVMIIRNKGYGINLIWPSDYGIHFYSDTLITSEQMISEQPGLTERFLRASLKGWQEAIANPKEAIDVTMKYARVQDRNLQTEMLSAMTPLVHTGKDRIGWMDGDVWLRMHEVLVDQRILGRSQVDFSKVYTMRFLKNAYSDQNKMR